MTARKEIDITENIASGNVEHIISILKMFLERGWDRLYWDGYDSSICLFKSSESEGKKDESLTTIQDLPKEVEQWLIQKWKKSMFG